MVTPAHSNAFLKAQEVLSTVKPHGDVTSFGAYYQKPLNTRFVPKEAVVNKIGAACLGSFNANNIALDSRFTPSDCKAVYIWTYPAGNVEHSKWYISYILNPNTSPWRDLIKAQEPQDIGWVIEYGYILTDLRFPANYVANFLTAYRLPREKPWICSLIYRLVHDGVSFGMAVTVATAVNYQFNPRNENTFTLTYASWHYAFEFIAASADTPKLINAGTPNKDVLSKHNFLDNTYYIPCNAIWISDYALHEMYGYKGPIYNSFKDFVSKGDVIKTVKRMFSSGENRISNNATTVSYEFLKQFCLYWESNN